tara:strand:- start:1462 stop:1680 length:219 start_codon:yes stop_codon:yes gene_type:complete
MYNDITWEYKGYNCLIEFDVEEDNVKAFHFVYPPEGDTLFLKISPYDTSKETVNKIIDDFIANGLDKNKIVG